MNCPRCNAFIFEDDTVCANCGLQLRKKEKKNTRIIVPIIIAIVIGGVILAVGKTVHDKMARYDYEQRVKTCAYDMYNGAADTEDACNKIVSVWHDSIWKVNDNKTVLYTTNDSGQFYDDFNDALNELIEDESFQRDLRNIHDTYENVRSQIHDLQDPPKGCEKICDALMDAYDAYYEFTQCALDPEGTYESYSNSFNEADSNCVKCMEKLLIYVE